jgi:hypothetical protein
MKIYMKYFDANFIAIANLRHHDASAFSRL